MNNFLLYILLLINLIIAIGCQSRECQQFSGIHISESGGHHFISGSIMGGTLIEDFQPGSMLGGFAITDIPDSLYDQRCLIDLFKPFFKVGQNLPDVVYGINELKKSNFIDHPQYTTALGNPFEWTEREKVEDFKNYISFRKTGTTVAGVYYLGTLHQEPQLLYEGKAFSVYRTLNGFYKVKGDKAKWLYISSGGSESVTTDTYKNVGTFGETSMQSLFFSRKLDEVNITYTLINLNTDSIYTLEDNYGDFLSNQLQ